MDIELLYERAQIIREVRSFFDSRLYLEVDTPLLAPDLIPENCLEVFETAFLLPSGIDHKDGRKMQNQKCWLIPSPEIWMKKLITQHRVNMYQICKCFRNSESRGHLHNPEFTMLEYYTMDADYLDSLALTEELFKHLCSCVSGIAKTALKQPFLRITMEEAFQRWAGFSLAATAAKGRTAMEKEAQRLGLEPDLKSMDDNSAIVVLYDLIFIHSIEPSLPKDQVVAILDYPAFVPCLAKDGLAKQGGLARDGHAKQGGSSTKERWELYFNGIELANCYSEETDPDEVRRYFEKEAIIKEENALVKHHIDREYWKTFLNGQKFACSGVAMGMDRLIMVFLDKLSIENVLPFHF